MPHTLVEIDRRKKKRQALKDKHALRALAKKGITNPNLRENLHMYFHEMSRLLTQVSKLRARVMSDDFFSLNPTFKQKLDESRETYQGVFNKTFSKLVDEAKEIDSIVGVGGFVINFIDTALDTIKQSGKVHSEFSKFLEEREEEAKEENIKALHQYRVEANTIKDSISRAWQDNITFTKSLPLDETQYKAAIKIINHEKQIATKLLDKLGQSLENLERHIQFDEIAPIKFVNNSLPHQLMTDFLINSPKEGPRSSIVFSVKTGFNPIRQFTTWLSHLWREANIRTHFLADIPNTIKLAAAQNILSSDPKIKNYQLSCLSAVLKRFPLVDYQAERFDYYLMKSQINRVTYLIQQAELNIEENLELVSPLAMCRVDLEAHWQLRLNEEMPSQLRNSFFHTSPFQADRHEALRRILDTHIAEMINYREQYENNPEDTNAEDQMRRRASTIHSIVLKIVKFYGEHLTTTFWESPLLKKAIENEAGIPGRQDAFNEKLRRLIEEEVIKLINNELQDATPSPYYAAPLCGLSQVITGLKGEGNITVSMNKDKHFIVHYSGDVFKPLERYNPNVAQPVLKPSSRTTTVSQPAQMLSSPYPRGKDYSKQPTNSTPLPARVSQRPVRPPPQTAYAPTQYRPPIQPVANQLPFFQHQSPPRKTPPTFVVRETQHVTPLSHLPSNTRHNSPLITQSTAYGRAPSQLYIDMNRPVQDWEFNC